MYDTDELNSVLTHLEQLRPQGRANHPTPPQALARFKTQTLSHRSMQPMFRLKPVLATVLVIVAVALFFSFPATRALAGNFLGLFRVQKFAPISISPEQIVVLEKLADQGLYPGELEMVQEPGPTQTFTNLEQALRYLRSSQPGFPAFRTAADRPDRIEVQAGGAARLTVNLANARQLLAIAGVDPQLLPDSLDGAVIDGRISASVMQAWGETMLIQMPTPQINYPPDVDVALVGEALLRILGMQPDEANRLAHNIDWTSTLVLPVPAALATFSEVSVDGTTGLALQSVDGAETTILWQSNNSVYLLTSANQDVAALVKFAENLRWARGY